MSTEIPQAIPAPAPRWPRLAALVGATLGAVAVAAGLVMLLNAGEGRIETIRVTKHSMLPESLVGSPDYYVQIGTRDNKKIETKGYADTPIGNGLDFQLPEPLKFEEIAHIELLDTDVGSDDMRDRVDVRERICRGQDYEFELLGPTPPRRSAGIVVLAAGGAVLAFAAILLVRTYAI